VRSARCLGGLTNAMVVRAGAPVVRALHVASQAMSGVTRRVLLSVVIATHDMRHFGMCCKQKQGAARPGSKSADTKPSPNSSVKVRGIHAQVGVLGKLCGKS
jgi:hypothetical protein